MNSNIEPVAVLSKWRDRKKKKERPSCDVGECIGGEVRLHSSSVICGHDSSYLYEVNIDLIQPEESVVCVFIDDVLFVSGIHGGNSLQPNERRLKIYLQLRRALVASCIHSYERTHVVSVTLTTKSREDERIVPRSLKQIYLWNHGDVCYAS